MSKEQDPSNPRGAGRQPGRASRSPSLGALSGRILRGLVDAKQGIDDCAAAVRDSDGRITDGNTGGLVDAIQEADIAIGKAQEKLRRAAICARAASEGDPS